MEELSRRDFMKLVAAAVAVSSGIELSNQVADAHAAKRKLPPPLDLKTLVKKAQAEGGEVVVYVGSSDLGELLGEGFKKAYPWSDPNLVVSSTGAIRTKILTEVNAKKGADVFSSAPSTPYIFIRAGAAAPVALVNDANLKELRDPTGYRHPYAQNIMCIAQNPNLASYVPTDIFEFSKPQFKGQLAMDLPDNLGVSALFLASHRKAWGDKKWMQWLQGLKDNNVLLTSSATSSYQAVLIGQRGLAAGTVADILSQPAGAPVKANWYTGAPPYIQALMKTSYAAHPYTADLFINWVLSTEGQKIIDSTNRTPSVDIQGAKNAVSTLVPKKFPIAPYSSISGYVFNPIPYTDLWHKYWPA
jgi:ABC-type Fe3+ transport system substrate-binding protein